MTDSDLTTPLHDEIMLWLDTNIDEILTKTPPQPTYQVFEEDKDGLYSRQVKVITVHTTLKEWQHAIQDSKGRIIGFTDMHCKMTIDLDTTAAISGRTIEQTCNIEVQTTIPSISELLRTIHLYQVHEPISFYVVSPDDRYADILRSQKIHFIKYTKD